MNTALLKRDGTRVVDLGREPFATGSDAELLAQMIHDIKNPLSAILCYAEIVAGANEDERREYCERLQANARAMLDLLDGFGLLVALRGQDGDRVEESFDWVRQVMRIAVELHAVASFRSQRIACASAGERFVRGDRDKLSVAIRSLLLEGLRGAAPGTTIDLRIRASGDMAAVEVMAPCESEATAATLFDQRRPAFELAARIAELHHGRLAFAVEGAAAVATLSVPLS